MTTTNIYLLFNGNCREAFEFYKEAFGGDFEYFGTYAEMPPQEGIPQLPDSEKDKIMHVHLQISKETSLLGSDTSELMGESVKFGNNFAISVNMESTLEADELFEKLSEGGNVIQPMDKTFWSAYYGSLTDKFSVNWMINVDLGENV